MSQAGLVKAHFSRMGSDGSYEQLYAAGTHSFIVRRERVKELLEPYLRPGQMVADIGCGTGPLIEFLCERGLVYYGIDVAEPMLESIRNAFHDKPYRERIHLKLGTSDNVPYSDAQFDILLEMGLLEYLDDMSPTFDELARLLRPGGLAILTIPNRRSLDRLILRNSEGLTTLYHWFKFGGRIPRSIDIIHHELPPGHLNNFMLCRDFLLTDWAFYNFKLIVHPLSRLFPSIADSINHRIENRGPGFLATGYIGCYRKAS
jgi:ubiquinone/menaquinone biosynthesis C-methylase UbiE